MRRVSEWVGKGRLNVNEPITMKHLRDSGCVSTVREGVYLTDKVCAVNRVWYHCAANTGILVQHNAAFSVAIKIEVSKADKEAIEKVEQAGGAIVCRFTDRIGLRAIVLPEKFPLGLPPPSMPMKKRDRGMCNYLLVTATFLAT